ncbi:MAG: hypothetical protein ABSB29_05145 [Nitrososphaerales archaeon]|jgi:hypothetical protein
MPGQPTVLEEWEDLNRLDTLMKVSLFSIITGMIFGIIILTGFDVSPEGIVQYVLGAIAEAFASILGSWVALVVEIIIGIGFGLYGIYQGMRTIQSITEYGTPGIVSGLTGFLGGLIVMIFSNSVLAGYAFLVLAAISLITAASFG